jgi:hypothetical protein
MVPDFLLDVAYAVTTSAPTGNLASLLCVFPHRLCLVQSGQMYGFCPLLCIASVLSSSHHARSVRCPFIHIMLAYLSLSLGDTLLSLFHTGYQIKHSSPQCLYRHLKTVGALLKHNNLLFANITASFSRHFPMVAKHAGNGLQRFPTPLQHENVVIVACCGGCVLYCHMLVVGWFSTNSHVLSLLCFLLGLIAC